MVTEPGSAALLLGVAQDAGVPQAGCTCQNCHKVREGLIPAQGAVSLALVDFVERKSWLIDCSPDFKAQYEVLRSFAPDCALAGVWLTHLHMGHYTGLFQFGKESMNWKGLQVYGTESVCDFFRSNAPWTTFVSDSNLVLNVIDTDKYYPLTPRLHIKATAVPHRGEYSDTVAYFVKGDTSSLFYCPDIDSWEEWVVPIRSVVSSVDVALLDGCFFSGEELPGRDMRGVPHPLVTHTAELLTGLERKVVIIHMNHTNPLYRTDSEQRAWCREHGLGVGEQGQVWALSAMRSTAGSEG